jgi:hypothetical protein
MAQLLLIEAYYEDNPGEPIFVELSPDCEPILDWVIGTPCSCDFCTVRGVFPRRYRDSSMSTKRGDHGNLPI